MSMAMNQPAVYWHKDQVAVTFHSDFRPTASTTKQEFLNKVTAHEDDLNALLNKNTPFTLKFLGGNAAPQQQMPEHAVVAQDNSGNIDGVYWFPSPIQPPTILPNQPPVVDLTAFYTIEMSGQSTTGNMASMGGTGSMTGAATDDHTVEVCKELYAQKGDSNASFMPHWFWAGTGDVTHGCPITPPMPASGFDPSGQWTFTLQQLAGTPLQDKTGAGVTVFILDAFPSAKQIMAAASNPGCNDLLVQMATGMVTAKPFNAVPPAININYLDGSTFPQDIVTGKDLYGRLAGFPMVDHGLAIAGIVRDLAPDANIECIQVLNDYGVGDLNTFANALKFILQQMAGDLYGKPVVINLSLVIGPPEGEMSRLTLDTDTLKLFLADIQPQLQELTRLGAILVASAGNDSDPRDTMHATGERLGPRYPANFAYGPNAGLAASIIPVGAVNRQGAVASYSNYPGSAGVATYGGELPLPNPPMSNANVITQVDTTVPLDAPCGVYSGSMYPALSMADRYPPPSPPPPAYPEYPAPDASAWAYWAGTSFATPIISALAARLLQGQAPHTIAVRDAITAAGATHPTAWTGIAAGTAPVNGPTILAVQEFVRSEYVSLPVNA